MLLATLTSSTIHTSTTLHTTTTLHSSASTKVGSFNWFETVSILLTLILAGATYKMAKSTEKLAVQAEKQSTIAARAEFAARQPVLIPVKAGTTQYGQHSTFGIWTGHTDASIMHRDDKGIYTLRLVLKNVGSGVASLPADRGQPQMFVFSDEGFECTPLPNSRTVGPGEIFEVSYVGARQPTVTVAAAEWGFDIKPALLLWVDYTDLTESMQMGCQIYYELNATDEVRAFKTVHTQPSPVTNQSPVPYHRVTLPNLLKK